MVCDLRRHRCQLERATGIEPAFSAWEADVLPLNYARVNGRDPHAGFGQMLKYAIRRMRCTMGRLDELDLTQQIGKGDYEKRLSNAQRRLLQLRLDLGGQMGSGRARTQGCW